MKPKILIIGHARHGKDTLAEIWRDMFNVKFESSSQAANRLFIYNKLKVDKGYKDQQECFEDRVNNRETWFRLIEEFNKSNPSRLASEILKSNDLYVGLRSKKEFNACKRAGLFDLVVWVCASKRLEKESKKSFNISKKHADIVVYNNGTLPEFKKKVLRLGGIIWNS